jgi:hypothetical protein
MTATSWSSLIAGFERSVEEAEAVVAAADRGDEPAAPPVWTVPDEPPTQLPTEAEMERFRRLQQRQETVAHRLVLAMGHRRDELADSRRRRSAARAYHS